MAWRVLLLLANFCCFADERVCGKCAGRVLGVGVGVVGTSNHLPEHHVLAVQVWRGLECDKKLTPVRGRPAVGHAEHARPHVLPLEVFV